MGDRLRFVFRNFPRTEAYMHALQAAEAAETAGAQGKFREMHDRLFEHQHRLDYDSFAHHARELKLNRMNFQFELCNHVYVPRVEEDFESGVESGVGGTPTFFVNGVKHDGGYDLDSLLTAVEAAAAAEISATNISR